ncbi:MAG: ribosome recycling factor [Gammaproteobacteria bacterium]|nr:ribosome recycling factor [Gammaproteobacteria bacterium]MCF6229818.1 ribosome recycling factor [Gammaproteobacteria bacterium]
MINEIKSDADSRMKKSIESLTKELSKLRTGRAHPSILDQVMVDYYGTPTPLSQVASVSVTDARTLTVTPWEKPLVPVIDKAILTANLGLNPVTSGSNIRVPLPPLTEERRRDLIKVMRGEGEQGRVAIRNIRRDAISDIKSLLKDKEITEDESRKAEDDIQKITDKNIAEIEKLLDAKEKDLMEI